MPAMVRTEARELVPTASKRAINLARGAATASNGGLRIYHPARCMYLNPTNNPCLTKRDAGGYEFRFQGGPPGWEVIGIPPSVSSIVLIAPDGRSVIAESHEKIKEVSLPALPWRQSPSKKYQPSPFTQEHDEYVFSKQIPIPLGMGFTISQSRFPLIQNSWSLLLTDARNWQKSSAFPRGSQMRKKLADDAYLCFTNPSYIRPKYAGSRLSPIHKQKN